ncbi:short-chain dehydrogenase TIC 32, chloroplastic-like isoform X1 [Amaranthus tricolor]|uniref:short-chain dehydrogenase TIC 32, chloroplastic-like isoform X1 n=1 Tax=Amaranthus tricolor TaxID=29722 RepID=UPI002582DF83|nr:short-chain dehydrogenase TIC 32, chloroplastic-like isoform X1 [Amaranthus tricolor]XP_057528585.1 short-chain dehydrogenase TIC 32, chloroplastic-like isoform X1 [Amaranthus tricolor]XP_057528586.1 short-chain dehydrogenase TIC 32, chloroplastic-like isoform X1 [Amaranthus tricolor]XP_057528587.1 short-chain dehydrogenase TIC 32, chloroplastic-like isoform X1 [Amaranthus tricolor]
MMVKEIYRAVKFICCIEFWRMSLLWTLSLVISHLRIFALRVWGHKYRNFPRQRVAPISASNRPICIITGATSGLGAAAAKALLEEGFFVILVGRSAHLLSKTKAKIHTLNENAQLETFEVDLSSFSSIMKLKNSLVQWFSDMNLHPSIQLLINNAGILATSYRTTDDGFDEMIMTNYMGAFCLTKVLLPLLIDSPVPSRIVSVSSFTHRNVYDLQVDEEFIYGKPSNFKQYPFAHIYGCSKLCVLLLSYELHQQFCKDKKSQLSVNVADPGAVKTNIMRELPQCLSQLAFLVLNLLGILQIPEKGVSSIIDAALAPPEISGMYFFGGNGRTIRSSPLSYDLMLAKRLWWISSEIFLEMKHKSERSTALSTCD